MLLTGFEHHFFVVGSVHFSNESLRFKIELKIIPIFFSRRDLPRSYKSESHGTIAAVKAAADEAKPLRQSVSSREKATPFLRKTQQLSTIWESQKLIFRLLLFCETKKRRLKPDLLKRTKWKKKLLNTEWNKKVLKPKQSLLLKVFVFQKILHVFEA